MNVREIADFVGGDLLGDPEVEISDIAAFSNAGPGHISFAENSNQLSTGLKLSCVIAPKGTGAVDGVAVIEVHNPKLEFARVGQLLHPRKSRTPQIHETAVVSDTAEIGEKVFIGAYSVIGDNAFVGSGTQLRACSKIGDGTSVGEDCIFHPNVFVEDGCTIGNRVILHSGVVVGTEGFGFVRAENEHVNFPQIGSVIIEDDVEIGAKDVSEKIIKTLFHATKRSCVVYQTLKPGITITKNLNIL